MKVFNSIFGEGEVVSQTTDNVTVNFNGAIKVLVIKFAKLTNEDGTPFGVHFEPSTKVKRTKFEKRLAAERVAAKLTPEQRLKRDATHSKFMKKLDDAVLADNFLPCQIESGNFNRNLIS